MLARRTLIAAALALPPLRGWAEGEPATDAVAVGEVQLPAPGGGTLPGYRAHPAGDGPFPAVLVVPDGPGIPAWLTEFCRHLARAGYCALAADVMGAGGDDEVLRRLDAVAGSVRQNAGDPARLAITGFGAGGRVTWLYAAHSPALKAAVAWYGPVANASTQALPKSALDVAADLRAPLLGLYGKSDPANPEPLLLRAERKANAAGHTAELIVYLGAGPGFAAPGTSAYRQAAASDGWDRMLAWLKRYLA